MQVHEIEGKAVGGRACSAGRDLGVVSVSVRDGKISFIEPGLRRGAVVVDDSLWLAPGLIDLQVNGGFGIELLRSPQSIGRLSEKLPSTGVLGYLPTLASPPLSTARRLAEALSREVVGPRRPAESGPIATAFGIHLEGPLLNPARAGAHPRRRLLAGREAVEHFAELAAPCARRRRGLVRMVTVAPEVEGASDLAAIAAEGRVVLAAGHTDADYDEGLRAIEGGIRVFTHLFNACRPIHHRRPGIAAAYLLDPNTNLTLICDGVHVAEPVVKMAAVLAGPSRIALVTDAVASLGRLSALDAGRTAQAATDPATGRLIGGTTPLSVCAANFSRFTGISFPAAVHSASGVPARILGLRDRGVLRRGVPAEFIALSEEGTVAAVAQDGLLFELVPGAVNRRPGRARRTAQGFCAEFPK